MIDVVEISIENSENKHLCSSSEYELNKGVNIIAKTDKGLQYGIVTKSNFKVKPQEVTETLFKVSRIANKEDFRKNKQNISHASKALKKCKNLIKKYKLNMSLINAYYNFDRSLLYFQFVSDERVDFRDLAKELASIYKTRIELRQIGVRDKAKYIGGCGPCGKELCCRQFLKDFESVSINNVKNQNLSLNPSKINGVCGRLLCCMKYEDECYKELRKDMPTIGKMVETDQGKGKVISIDILKQTYRVDLGDKGIIECEVNGSNK